MNLRSNGDQAGSRVSTAPREGTASRVDRFAGDGLRPLLTPGTRANEPLRLQAQGFETALMTVDDFAPLPGPGVVVGDELLGADAGMVHDFAAAVVAAQQQIADDPAAGVDAAIVEVPAIADDRDTAQAVLEATIEAWGPPVTGQIVTDVWASGYETMQRLGFIDGSVPVDEMYDATVMAP